ncbi:MAG: hypothetical protein Ct9H90mP2_08420 [Dehalococcoidia bacterium]|nr:MAG: hypothetical protein Ct9H90mP2_08420 [Dehalococcoidia bacterium]
MPQLHDIKRKNKNTPKNNQVGRGNASKGTYSGRGNSRVNFLEVVVI